MKTRLLTFSWPALGLLVLAVALPARVEAQQDSQSLVTVTTNGPAAPSQPAKTYFVLKPFGVVAEVEKLTKSGTDPAVVKAFVQNWHSAYSVSADDILHLHEVGVPSDTLTTLIQHQAQLGSAVAAPSSPAPYPEAIPQISQPSSPPPPVPEQYAPAEATYAVEPGVYSAPVYAPYDYSYYYGYPAPYYYSGVAIGLGYGGYYGGYHGYHGGYHGYYGGYHGGNGGYHGGYGGHGGAAHGGGAMGGRGGGGFGGHAGGGSFGGRGGGGQGSPGGGHR